MHTRFEIIAISFSRRLSSFPDPAGAAAGAGVGAHPGGGGYRLLQWRHRPCTHRLLFLR